MKNGLILLSMLLWSATLGAQSLTVTVRDTNEPLAFANIYLNGRYLISADSTGTAAIPEGLLSPGDTISSSFLGFEPARAVYDDAARAARAVTLVHEKDRIYEVEEVVVTARLDGWAAFGQFVNPTRAAFIKTIAGNFEAVVRMPDGSVREIGGIFSTRNAFRANDFLYSRESEITVNHGDTTGLDRLLRRNMSYLRPVGSSAIRMLHYLRGHIASARTNPYRTLTYLGTQNDRRNFTLTYVNSETIDGTNQYLWSIDAESGAPRSIHFATTAQKGAEAAVYSSSFELVPYRRRTSYRAARADFREVDGIRMELKMTDLAAGL